MDEWKMRMLDASAAGEFLVVQKLLKKFVSPNVIDTTTGLSALSLATKGGHTSVVKSLLDAGAKATVMDNTGLTPLHLAAKGDYSDIVKLLVLNNAALDVTTSSGLTPLDFTLPGTESQRILFDAKNGIIPEFNEVSEVPIIPAYAIENAFKKAPKKSKESGGKKKKKKK